MRPEAPGGGSAAPSAWNTQDGVSLRIEGGVAKIRLDNPPLNVLSNHVRRALFQAVRALESRDDVHVVTVESGATRAFSVGSDIREFPEDELGGIAKIRFEQYLLNHLAALPQVVVCKLRGLVLGGGAEVMLTCDLRIAASTAEIGFPEIRIGGLPVAGGIKRLVQDVGPVQARRLVYSGQSISAEHALSIGLITEVVDDAALDSRVDEIVAELLSRPHDALRTGKRVLAAAIPATDIDSIEADAFGALYRGSNLHEGVKAFVAKRPPRFNAQSGS